MTIAICIKCGGKKFGAFSTCARCSVKPANSQELAHSMMFSSHNYSFKELDEIGAQIARTGKIPIFAENKERILMSAVENSPYLDLILTKELPVNHTAKIRNDLGLALENILKLPGVISGWLRKHGGRLNRRERQNSK